MSPQESQAIPSRTINLVIGGIALMLGPLLMAVGYVTPALHGAQGIAPSISDYYCYNLVTRDIFVGMLSAVGVLMLCYRGWYFKSAVIDRVIGFAGCIAALAIANLPCCDTFPLIFNQGHFAGAALLFLLLAFMLIFRFTDRIDDRCEMKYPYWKALRNIAYRFCGFGILTVSIGGSAMIFLQKRAGTPGAGALSLLIVEMLCLTLFGLGWLAKSRYLLGYERDKAAFLYRREEWEAWMLKRFPSIKRAADRQMQKSGTGLPVAGGAQEAALDAAILKT